LALFAFYPKVPVRFISIMAITILWIYIVFLIVGGAIGFFKAGSKVSLVMAIGFALLLGLCNVSVLPFYFAYVFLGLLLVVFGIRLGKTKKFMPSGLMLLATTAALGLLFFSK
jgi:uncharacterized membrane protein (UPF0136 family)